MIHLLGGKTTGQSSFISNCYHHHDDGEGVGNDDAQEDGSDDLDGTQNHRHSNFDANSFYLFFL